MVLGAGLWCIASLWAAVAIRGADADKCEKGIPLCDGLIAADESNPFEDVRKAR